MKRQTYLKMPYQQKQKLALSRYKSKLFVESSALQPLPKDTELLSKLIPQQDCESRTSFLFSLKSNQIAPNQQRIQGKSMLPPISKNSIDNNYLKETKSTFKLSKSKSTFHRDLGTKMSFDVNQGLQPSNQPRATFSDLMHQIYGKLNEIFTINQELGITPLRKPAFNKALLALVQFLQNNLKNEMDERLNQTLMKFLYQKQFKLAKVQVFQSKKNKLKLKTKEVQIIFITDQYQQRRKQLQRQINQVNNEKYALNSKIQQMTNQLLQKTQLYAKKQGQLKNFEQRIQNLRVIYQSQELKHKNLKKTIEETVEQLEKIQYEQHKIANFVQQQKEKKSLHEISQEYKQIQGQIYEYANYLQKNVVNRSIKTSQRLYKNLIKQIKAQINKITRNCLSLQDSPEEIKGRSSNLVFLIQDLLANVENKVKDVQNKSQSCKKIIKMVYRWIDIWNSKQKYLINLRKEFFVDSKKIYQLFDSLQQTFAHQAHNQKQNSIIAQLKKFFQKIEMNYKYGNSFY